MKILIVDDSQDKIREIMKTLLEVDGIQKSMIDYSRETNDALQKTKRIEYDLLVLDLNMPETILDENDENAGASFVDELLGVFAYNKPMEIVVLSAYDRFEEKFIEDKTHVGFKLLRYDETSLEWKSKLQAVVKYRLLYAEQKMLQEPIDYAIITAVPVETDAVKKMSSQWTKVKFEDDNLTYYIGEITENNLSKKVVTVQCYDMGMVAATVATLNISHHFKPKYIIMVGIAAGIGEHNLGDIIVPREVWNYSSGKYKIVNGENAFIPDPKVLSLDDKVLEIIREDHTTELAKIKSNWPDKIKDELNLDESPIACGSAVVANKGIVDEMILAHFRKSGALDMESYGMFFASKALCESKPIAICIKSISDFADSDKGDGYQPYAAYTSASFAKYLIMSYL